MTADRNRHDFEDARAALSHKVGASRLWVLECSRQEVLDGLLDGVDHELVRVVQPLWDMPVRCVDLRAAGKDVREQGEALVADLTLPGPLCCDALRLGAHAFLVCADEGLCVVALSRDGAKALPRAGGALDALAQADEGDCLRVIALLEQQQAHWRATSDAAQVIASFLRCHPAVEELRYPGLRDDPSFEIAARTLQRGFGPLVDFRLVGGDWQRCHAMACDVRGQVLELEHRLSIVRRPS